MTVGELKDLLKDKDDNLLVLRGDNSGGYETAFEVVQEPVQDHFAIDKPEQLAVIIH